MRRSVVTTAIIGVTLCAVPSAAAVGPHSPAVHSNAGAVHPRTSATASATRLFLNIREAKREIRAFIKETEAKAGATPTYINVYACRRHSRVRVHCRFFERGTGFSSQLQQTVGYKCTGKARLRETRREYVVRFTGVSCFAFQLGQ